MAFGKPDKSVVLVLFIFVLLGGAGMTLSTGWMRWVAGALLLLGILGFAFAYGTHVAFWIAGPKSTDKEEDL